MVRLPIRFYYQLAMLNAVLNPRGITTSGLASSHFARRYFGNLFWFLFLRLLRCFSSAGLPTYDYFIHHRLPEYCSGGFPHSEICGSMLICSSPQLIAAYHVLLRLLMPRHSPCALLRLTFVSLYKTISRSPCDLIMWVSLSVFRCSSYPHIYLYIRAFFLKKPDFFLTLLFIQFSNINSTMMMVEK